MTVLSDELTNDPLSRGYFGMTDAQVVASINAKTRPGPIPADDVKRYLLMQGKWGAIVDDADKSTVEADRQSCLVLVQALTLFDEFDLQDAAKKTAVQAALDALKTTGGTGHITDAEATTIMGLENNRQSRAQELGLGGVTAGQIAKARG